MRKCNQIGRSKNKGNSPWNKGKFAKIMKNGKDKGRQKYRIYSNGKTLKTSLNPNKLLKWFTQEYYTEILVIKIDLDNKIQGDKSKYNKFNYSNKYARIIKKGVGRNGKQLYGIKKDKKILYTSYYLSSLLQQFSKDYPNEILIL